MYGRPCIALINNSPVAVGFSSLSESENLSKNGTLTPDHVIRTKPFAWIINNELNKSALSFVKSYNNYFIKNKTDKHKKLDTAPRWALWKNNGTISFGETLKAASIVYDINNHTVRAMQTAQKLEKWKPISMKSLFEVEYWDLEQAKLKKAPTPVGFSGKIAIVTGAASGIGYATVQKLLHDGCCVVGLDKNKKIKNI